MAGHSPAASTLAVLWERCLGNAMHWKQCMRRSCAHSNPCSVALDKLVAVERAYAALASATRFKGSKLSQDVLALDHLLSLLFTACTRVRGMG